MTIRASPCGSPNSDREDRPLFLTLWRACSSRLLQLDRLWLLAEGRHVAWGRCPECGTVDHVTDDPAALWAWRRQTHGDHPQLELNMHEVAAGDRNSSRCRPSSRPRPAEPVAVKSRPLAVWLQAPCPAHTADAVPSDGVRTNGQFRPGCGRNVAVQSKEKQCPSSSCWSRGSLRSRRSCWPPAPAESSTRNTRAQFALGLTSLTAAGPGRRRCFLRGND